MQETEITDFEQGVSEAPDQSKPGGFMGDAPLNVREDASKPVQQGGPSAEKKKNLVKIGLIALAGACAFAALVYFSPSPTSQQTAPSNQQTAPSNDLYSAAADPAVDDAFSTTMPASPASTVPSATDIQAAQMIAGGNQLADQSLPAQPEPVAGNQVEQTPDQVLSTPVPANELPMAATPAPPAGLSIPAAQPASTAPQQFVITEQQLEELNASVAGVYALFTDINNKLPASGSKTGGNGADDPVERKELLAALGALRVLQNQMKVQKATIESLKSQLNGGAVVQAPGLSVKNSMRQAPQLSNEAIARTPSGNRNTRELAWASYIENFGVAKIEGTVDLIELRPGDNLIGRGQIENISEHGCIRFVGGSVYAPTNGVCK